jgi:hypothetical protein
MQRILITTILLILVGLSGCSIYPSYSQSQIDEGLLKVTQCLARQAKFLDDKISPADSVAIGVAAACKKEIDIYDNMRVPNNGTIFANSFYANRHQGWHKSAVMAVLVSRKN